MKKAILFIIVLGFQSFPQTSDTLKILTGCFFSDSLKPERMLVTRYVRIDSFVTETYANDYIPPKPLDDISLFLNNIKYDDMQMQFYADHYWTSVLDFSIDENGNIKSLYVRDSLVLHYDDDIIKKELQKLKFTPCRFENKSISVNAKLYITSYPQIKEYFPNINLIERDYNENELISLNEPFIAEKYSTGNQRRKEAREDIANGYILIIHGGMLSFISPEVDSIANTFGFHFIRGGCTDVYGNDEYNNEVVNYLSKINGKGWWNRFLNEVLKLNLNEPQSLPTIKDN
jgi:hypothetical protein